MKTRTLYFGDNLRVLREKFSGDEGYFDLIYLDPPFNSQQTYNVLFKEGIVNSPAQVAAFEDTWHWTVETQAQFEDLLVNPRYAQKISDVMQGMAKVLGHNDVLAYLTMMAVRLVELHRVLKPTGTMYVHCDPTASHYLKIILDAVFGPKHFLNEIVWKRHNARSTTGRWPHVHDIILLYAKSDDFVFNPARVAADKNKLPHTLITGADGLKYQTYELTAPGETKEGESGKAWRGFDPGKYGRHWGNTGSTMDAWDAAGLIHWPKDGGFPRRRGEAPFDPETREVVVGDVWTDIDRLNQTAKERLGYPTQKPEALLERIIRASSKEGDWVLDPFGGCGTTAAAAEKLARNWVVIDITTLAINLVKRRIEKAYPERRLDLTVEGYPADLAGARELLSQDAFEFEYWCCDLVEARPAGGKTRGHMKGADKGIDGVITLIEPSSGGNNEFHSVLVQVKGGHVGSSQVRDFRGTIERENALAGVFITLEHPSGPMLQEAIAAGTFTYAFTGRKYPLIQIITVEDLLKGKRPELPNVMAYNRQATQATAVPEQGSLLTSRPPRVGRKR